MTNTEIMAGTYEAFGRGDIPAVLGMLDPQVHWYEAESNPLRPSGEAWVGPDAVMNDLFAKLPEEWAEFAVHTGSFHDAGDVVVVEGRYTGTHATTGKSLDAQFCHVWTLSDGKITKFQQYVDTAKLQDTMGAR